MAVGVWHSEDGSDLASLAAAVRADLLAAAAPPPSPYPGSFDLIHCSLCWMSFVGCNSSLACVRTWGKRGPRSASVPGGGGAELGTNAAALPLERSGIGLPTDPDCYTLLGTRFFLGRPNGFLHQILSFRYWLLGQPGEICILNLLGVAWLSGPG